MSAIEINMETIEFILERCRDSDPTIRKFVFGTKLFELDPNDLTIQHRQYLVKVGLAERYFTCTHLFPFSETRWLHNHFSS